MKRWLARQIGWVDLHGLPFVVQFLVFGFAFSLKSSQIWLPVLAVSALLNLWAWVFSMRWHRAIVDTPTSRVASAAQGYVELIGVGQPLADTQLLSPFTQLPCLWYRYTVERKEGDKWEQVDHGASDLPFVLQDDSGRCEIDPVGAVILTTHKEIRTQGDERHTEYVLLKGDRLYALGDFVSYNGAQTVLNARVDVGDLLAEWKTDQGDLRRRFDRDRDGAIDEQEWQAARDAAEDEVARRHQEIRNQPTQHRLQKPGSSKPYLIANHPPEKLGRRYAWFSALYLALLLGCLFGIGWAMRAVA